MKRPRIADVARLAGVSEGTVSVVLNNRVGEHVRVSEETQQRIRQAVRELGYVANPMAQSLAGGQNRIIAIFTFESIFPIDSRNFYYPFLIGVEEEADAQGYDILLVTGSNGTRQGQRHIYQHGINRLHRADGAILIGVQSDNQEVRALLEERYPFVFVGRRESPGDDISYAAADYVEAAAEVVAYLVQNQHQQIAYIKSTNKHEAARDREAGIRLGHERAGLSLPNTNIWNGTVADLTLDLLHVFLGQGITAFVTEDDMLGNQILQLAAAAGLKCPRDFSLATLGDPLSMAEPAHRWTTFKIPRQAMGREAVRLLVRRLNEDDAGQVTPYRSVLPCTFVPGLTVASISRV